MTDGLRIAIWIVVGAMVGVATIDLVLFARGGPSQTVSRGLYNLSKRYAWFGFVSGMVVGFLLGAGTAHFFGWD
jgi:hypothetical protein